MAQGIEWTVLQSDSNEWTERAPVEGGHLYKCTQLAHDGTGEKIIGVGLALTFVPSSPASDLVDALAQIAALSGDRADEASGIARAALARRA